MGIKDTCPWCLQPINNLENNPEFVNKNPNKMNSQEIGLSKDIEKNENKKETFGNRRMG